MLYSWGLVPVKWLHSCSLSCRNGTDHVDTMRQTSGYSSGFSICFRAMYSWFFLDLSLPAMVSTVYFKLSCDRKSLSGGFYYSPVLSDCICWTRVKTVQAAVSECQGISGKDLDPDPEILKKCVKYTWPQWTKCNKVTVSRHTLQCNILECSQWKVCKIPPRGK